MKARNASLRTLFGYVDALKLLTVTFLRVMNLPFEYRSLSISHFSNPYKGYSAFSPFSSEAEDRSSKEWFQALNKYFELERE